MEQVGVEKNSKLKKDKIVFYIGYLLKQDNFKPKKMFSKTCKYAMRSVLYLALQSGENKRPVWWTWPKHWVPPNIFLPKSCNSFPSMVWSLRPKGQMADFIWTKKTSMSAWMRSLSVLMSNSTAHSSDSNTLCTIQLPQCRRNVTMTDSATSHSLNSYLD